MSPSPAGEAASRAGTAGSVELLERSGQLTELRELFLGVDAGAGGCLVFVTGEAGVGKSALVRKFCDEHAHLARIQWGCCDAFLPARPLGPVSDIAEAIGGRLATLVARTPPAPRPHEVVSAWLAELDGVPAVAVLEDVHWADEATLDLLEVLGRRIHRAPAFVIATLRDDELPRGHQLRAVLGGLATTAAVHRLQVPPLSITGTRHLAARSGMDGDELHRKTGGNPFFVTEILAANETGVPRTVRDAVLARAGQLSAAAQAALETVAVVPPRATLWLLEALDRDAVSSLDECVGSGMLTEDSTGVAFRHELARLAVENSIPPARRLALHRRTVTALAAPPSGQLDLARLAYHAERAGRPELVSEFAPPAGDQAASLGAHREAAAQYGRALSAGDGLTLRRRAELLERWAYECYVTHELGDAVAGRRQAHACYRDLGDPRKQGDQLRWLSRLYWLLGRYAEADREGRAAVEVLEGLAPGAELAMAYSNLSQLRMLEWDASGSLTWGLRAIRLAKTLDDSATLVHALTNVGAAELVSGADRGRERLERALDMAVQQNLDEHVVRACFNLGVAGVQRRAYDLGEHYLSRGSAHADARGLVGPSWNLLAWRARMELDQGRWARAGELAGRVLARSHAVPPLRVPAGIVLGLVRTRRGEPGGGRLLDDARSVTGPRGAPQDRVPLAAAIGERAWLRGDPNGAVAEALQAYESVLTTGNDWATGELALWLHRLGATPDPPPEAALPYALELAGEWRRASECWDALGCPYEAALALAAGDETALRESLRRLQELGASPAANLVARRLREHGARGLPRGHQRAARRNPAHLTRREQEILVLMAQGMRNAEIAQRLFVSAKTVDHHVSSVLRKLGARSRGEASAKARQLGLLEAGGEPRGRGA